MHAPAGSTAHGACTPSCAWATASGSLKKELVNRESWSTRRELGAAVFEYIEVFYNRERRHSTLGYCSPREFEMITHPAQLEDQEVKP